MQKNRLVYVPQIAHAYHLQIVRAVPLHLSLSLSSQKPVAPRLCHHLLEQSYSFPIRS